MITEYEYNEARKVTTAYEEALKRSDMMLTKREKELLTEVFGRLYTEAYYDPTTKETQELAIKLFEKMNELNKTMRFRL